MSETGPTRSWAPVDAPHRAVALDVVRGLAIAGVLVANTLTFAYPIASSQQDLPAWQGSGAADRAALLAVALFVEGRFYTLLSVLFGLGLVLQAERARAVGRPFARFYLRRAGFLFLIGLLHGVLLYAGDILAFYAVVSVAALPLLRLRLRTLTVATVVFALLGVGILAAYAWSHPERPYPGPRDWSLSAPQLEANLNFIERGAAEVLELAGMPRERFFTTVNDEARTYRDGSWLEQTKLRAITSMLLALPSKVLMLGCMFLSFFAFGMSVGRRIVAAGAGRPGGSDVLPIAEVTARRWRALWHFGTPAGLAVMMVGSAFPAVLPGTPIAPPIYWVGVFGGCFLQSLGYAAGLLLLAARRPDTLIVRALAAVGRTALSNYLLQSVLLGFVFYGTGLGLFTALTALPVVALAIPVFALEAWISRLWLRGHTLGPVEWAWRCLAYGQRLPLRRATRDAFAG